MLRLQGPRNIIILFWGGLLELAPQSPSYPSSPYLYISSELYTGRMLSARSRPLTPLNLSPLEFPAVERCLAVTPAGFPAFIQSLAVPSSYNLTAAPLARLKYALYSFALRPDSPHQPLLSDEPIPLDTVLEGAWSLLASQRDVLHEAGEYSNFRRGKVCGHVFQAGESVYRCRDCSLDATCVLCATCYRASTHCTDRHNITMSVHSGVGAGSCDCGDGEAFHDGCPSDCSYHCLRGDSEPAVEVSPEVAALRAYAEELLNVLVDWMIRVLESSPESMVAPTSVADILASGSSSQFLQQPITPVSAERILSPTAPNPFNFTIPPLYASSSSSTSRGKARDSSSSSQDAAMDLDADQLAAVPAEPWSVILWNDEKHSFVQVIDQVSRAIGCSRREASESAQRVDTQGRDLLYVSTDPVQLLRVAKTIAAIDLAVTVRPALDTFYEQVAGEIICFMKDLCAVKVEGEGGVLTEVLAKVLLKRGGVRGMSRFQRLIGVDSRMWKAPRKRLAELYVTLLGVSPQVKTDLSESFFSIYAPVDHMAVPY